MKMKESVLRSFMIVSLILPFFLTSPLISFAETPPEGVYAGDQERPYFKACNVHLLRTSSGVQTTFYVEVYNPNGAVPGTIHALRVTYPDGTTFYDFTPSDYIGSNGYFRAFSGQQPQVGEYTFTLTDAEGHTAATYFYYGGGPELPVPNASTLQASGSESGGTLSWGGLQGYEGDVFYRARIFGQAGNTLWTSEFVSGTSVNVPGHVMSQALQDLGPKWRVEAFDNHSFTTSYNRSNSNQVNLALDNSTPYFDFAVILHRQDTTAGPRTQLEVFVKDPDGDLPSSIQSLEVYDSSDQQIATLSNFNYDPAFDVFFFLFSGSAEAGVYRFVVTDQDNHTKTSYDYLGPVYNIPIVDSATYQAWGDPLAPVLSWAAPATVNGPLYYQVIIEDGEYVRAWGSARTTETSVQVPPGLLQPGVSYTWYIRTTENRNYVHYSHQGRSPRAALSVNPTPDPYFRWAGAHRRHDVDGSFTGLSAAVIDPAGALPGSLTSLTVETPLGHTHVLVTGGSLEPDVTYVQYFSEFFFRAPGAFQPGLYTFTLVKGDFTLVSHDWVGDTPLMPLVDEMSITVSGNPAAPTVSWSGVSGFEGNVYYRLRVDDTMGNLVHMSSRDHLTAQKIPAGKLEPGKTYVARVEAQEHPDWLIFNSRSNTDYVWWSAEGAAANTEGKPYFDWCNVHAMNTPDGIRTALTAQIADPYGSIPAGISSFTVTGPGDFVFDFSADDFLAPPSNAYWAQIPGMPADGLYTFTVTNDLGETAESSYYLTVGNTIPVPDVSTLQASGNPLAPTLSWGAVDGYAGDLFYRARIFDDGNNIVWTSGFITNTSVVVPGWALQENMDYFWRLEVFDQYTYMVAHNRAVSEIIPLVIDDQKPYFNHAFVYSRTNAAGEVSTALEINVVDPNGEVPANIASITVTGPNGFNAVLTSGDYLPGWGIYWRMISGLPAEGVYQFTVTDGEGKTATTCDYVKPVSLPLVDVSTMQASGNPLAPTLSWGVPSGVDRPVYFRVIIEEIASGNRVWASGRSSSTWVDVPPGILQDGVAYRWHIRMTDNDYWGHYHQETLSPNKDLVVDNESPFFQWATVYRFQDTQGFFTVLDASVRDPDGNVPSTIQSLMVSGPGVNLDLIEQEYFYNEAYNEFYLAIPGRPLPGLYTFTVTDADGRTAVTRDYVVDAEDIPLVDPSSIRVSGDVLAPAVSWDGIPGYEGHLFYRLRIFDEWGNNVYMSGREPVTSMTVPSGIIQAGRFYTIRIEAQDHRHWITYNSRSNSAYAWWSGDSATPPPVGGTTFISGTLDIEAFDGQGAVTISVYRSDAGAFNPMPENLLASRVISPDEYFQGMLYMVSGVPVGAEVYVVMTWDADSDGDESRGDYTAKAGPFILNYSGLTGEDLRPTTMFGYDDASPYIAWCNVQALYTPGTAPDNVQATFAVQVFDPNGAVPDNISSVRVTGPGVDYTFVMPADYSGGGVYWHGDVGRTLQVGEYTFTVTDDEGKTATSRYYFPGGTAMPLPVTATFQASGNALAPTLSWGASSTYQGNLFYRARVYDGTGTQTLWTSGFTSNTSVNVPLGIIQEGISYQYQWRVEAFDAYRYEASNQRAVSSRIPLSLDTKPYFNSAAVYHRRDQDGSHWTHVEAMVVDPNGGAPATIQSLEVYTPQGTLAYSFGPTDYFSAFNVYSKKLSGEPVEGIYRFEVTDSEGKAATSYDYVIPGTIPVVDSATLQASGPDPTRPMLSWGAPSVMDRPLYFRAIVEDTEGNRKWGSGWISTTSVQMPAGMLQSGGAYKWHVRASDDSYYTHYNDESRSGTKDLVLSEPIVGMDNSRPFFNWAVVFKRHEPAGIFTTLSASVTDPNGMAPGSLQSLMVTGPGGFSLDLLEEEYFYSPQYNEISVKVLGAPLPGVYTFTVTDDEGKTAVSHDWVGEAPDIPLVEQGTIQVSGDLLAPTISWSGVSGYEGNLYYRVLLQDLEGNIVYIGPRDAWTAQTIPYGTLQSNRIYLARAEAQDHRHWGVYNSRSNSGWVLWATGEAQVEGIAGRVTDEQGNPIFNVHVYAVSDGCGGHWAGGANTDHDGNYLIPLAPGMYVVRSCAACSGLPYVDTTYDDVFSCDEATLVLVEPRRTTEGIDFVLEEGGTLSGRVVDTSGNPIPNIHVYADDYTSGEWRGGADTGPEGYYSIVLPTGSYRVRSCAGCYDMDYLDEWYNDTEIHMLAAEVHVTVPDDTPDIDFELEATLKRPTEDEASGDGLAWLAQQQNPLGSWGGVVEGTKYELGKTALAVLAFAEHAREQDTSPLDPDYAYQANVVNGLNFIFANAYVASISPQPAGNPDTNGNGIGVYFTWQPDVHHVNYYTAIAAMAIAATGDPDRVVNVPESPVHGRTYAQVVQDVVDYLAWGQTDSGLGRGGWNYGATNSDNTRSDQSNTGWVTLALAYAEAAPPHGLGVTIPGFVRTELNFWINTIQDAVDGDDNDGGSYYTGEPLDVASILRTGNLLQQMAFVGDTTASTRVQAAIDYMVRHWEPEWQGSPICYQAAYITMKGLEALGVETIGETMNWFAYLSDRIRKQQSQAGWWPLSCFDDGDKILSTTWAILTLQKAVAPTEENPDLAILDVQVAKGTGTLTVSFTVKNQGNLTAPAGHDAGLSVEGVPVGQVSVPVDLQPEETYTNNFAPVNWTSGRVGVSVCADIDEEVAELNEDNNCFTLIWPPPTPMDINADFEVTLADAIAALQVVAGVSSAVMDAGGDVSGDGRIGMVDAIYILQYMAGLR